MVAENTYQSAAIPDDERARLEELRLMKLLNTGTEARFDRIINLAADLFDVPIAVFSLVDVNREWFKSAFGLTLTEVEREISFCAHAILEPDLLIIPDATCDPRFAGNPLVTGIPHIRFYAGAIVRGPHGKALGTLCLVDHVAREFSQNERRRLLLLADILQEEARHENATREACRRAAVSAHHDPVTGLPNARLFSDRLDRALGISRHSEEALMVGLVAVKGLVDVRAVLGDAVGNAVLKACADRLRNALSDFCTIARWRQETFALLVPVISHPGEADAFLTLVYETLAEPVAVPGEGRLLQFEPVCGAAVYPDSGLDCSELLRHAALALREADGDGQVHRCVYSGEMNDSMTRRVSLEQRLREAVNTGGLEVAFQPIASMANLEIDRVEALCRWDDPVLGRVSTKEFIDLAERSNLIVDLDRHVIRKAMTAVLEWDQSGAPPLMLSVNLSSRSVMHPDLVEWLQDTRTEIGLDAARITLEITENSLIANMGSAHKNLLRCRELGFRVSIDDFGTGFSSFNYLKRLAVDELKVDRVFVKEITDSKRDASIVRSIASLARDLGIAVVCEGIETYGQLIYLKAHQCDHGQGYYFSPAVKPDALMELLSKNSEQHRQ